MSKLKGVSLSVETIIIIVICILVLAVIVLFFTGVFNPAGKGITSEANLQKECLDWQGYGYDYSYFDETRYPGLKTKFGGAPTAKAYCAGFSTKVELVNCTNTNCTGIPMANTVCCCEDNCDSGKCDWYTGTACP